MTPRLDPTTGIALVLFVLAMLANFRAFRSVRRADLARDGAAGRPRLGVSRAPQKNWPGDVERRGAAPTRG
jgi:hypothetical protein